MSVRQANLPDHEALWRRDIERRLRALETSNRLESASIGSGGIRVHGSGAIRSGDFDGEGLDEPGTAGWWLGPEGLVVNRAVVRSGPQVRIAHAVASPEPSLGTSFATVVSVQVEVPDWADTAQLLALGSVSAFETGLGGGVDFFARAVVDGDGGAVHAGHAEPYGFAGPAHARSVAPGSTVTVAVEARRDAADTLDAQCAVTALLSVSD